MFGKNWTKIFSFTFLFSVLSVGQSFAEYLLVKKTNKEMVVPSFRCYKRAIEIVKQWRFPNYLRAIERLNSLSEQDLEFLCNNEQEFIKNKLDEAGINLELVFVPTVFYEFLILTDLDLCKELKQKESIRYETIDVPDYPEESDTIFKHFIDSYESCNYKNDFYVSKDFYYKVNNLIFISFKENSFSFLNAFFNRIKQAVKEYNDPEIEQASATEYILKHLKTNFSYLTKIFDFEFLAHNHGCFSLYRGTCGYNGVLDVLKTECESMAMGLSGYGLSYGNSIFAGVLSDRGASAFTYIFDNDFVQKEKGEDSEAIGYSFFIPKLNYVKEFVKSGVNNILFVSPVNTINGLISKGELFHSRILAISSDDEDTIRENRQMFGEYLKEYAFIIKNQSGLSDRNILGLKYEEYPEEVNLPYRLFMEKTRKERRRKISSRPKKVRV